MRKEIRSIQSFLKDRQLDAYLVFTNDDHGSEYVVDRFKFRAFLSGFTGSAGTMVITKDECCLWTDGRYFIQAERQLTGTGIRLMKSGEPGVPTISKYLSELGKQIRVAMDFRIVTASFVRSLEKACPEIELIDEQKLEDQIWTDRPQIRPTPAWFLTPAAAGESVPSKLARLREKMVEADCPYAFLAALDDIAWLYNMRGSDILYNPVNYAFSLVSGDQAILYMDERKLDKKGRRFLEDALIEIRPYESVYEDLSAVEGRTLIDEDKTNYALFKAIKDRKSLPVFPVTMMKACKNDVEIRRIKKAHLDDAVAMVRFMRYLKTRAVRDGRTEITLSDKLEAFRRESKDFLDLSFDTICATGAHGAIVHYSATPETDVPIQKNTLCLVDSGAQYRTGTTDITRTYAVGKVSATVKRDYTLVLKGHIALASAVFPAGKTGYELDMLSREPLYRHLMDFRHGTGHGVGYILNVHEGPQRITNRIRNAETETPMTPGMVTSNEPGLYLEGQYGIRHENLVLCVEKGQSEYGAFYGFENLTWVPFDLDAIDKTSLNSEEIRWLNDYHETVYRKLSGKLDPATRKYLRKVTRPL
ncbi:MAG: aminopeptidase P family protein [Clostridia bacterium]|nr:aminopeptidase P family protein [Clostridia bacterium]